MTESPCRPHPEPDAEDELVAFLERDQLVSDKHHPVPRAGVSRRLDAGLWALRVFGLVMGVLVVYTFIAQLHT